MTITTTIQSEQTGIRRTEMDILFRNKGLYKTILQAITPAGFSWIVEHMDHADDYTVTVDTEFADELRSQMEKDGLRVR